MYHQEVDIVLGGHSGGTEKFIVAYRYVCSISPSSSLMYRTGDHPEIHPHSSAVESSNAQTVLSAITSVVEHGLYKCKSD